MQRQPLEVQTIYAELLEQLSVYEASRSIGHTAGSFVTKMVKGQEYYYFQHVAPGGTKRQTYAWDTLVDQGMSWVKRVMASTAALDRISPTAAHSVRSLAG